MKHAATPVLLLVALVAVFVAMGQLAARADEVPPEKTAPAPAAVPTMDARELVKAGGWIGLVILALSVAMLALVVEHALSIRRSSLCPHGLAEAVHQHVSSGQFGEARRVARDSRSFLGDVLDAGLAEADLGYGAVEKAMEDTAVARTSRLYRKIEFLSIIGTIAPMLGLLGTVWGMIGAFLAFEAQANPQVSELAPGITRALVTTFLGLGVAVPALAGYGIFRNRIEGLTDEGTQLAEHVFTEFKRKAGKGRKRVAERAGGNRGETPARGDADVRRPSEAEPTS